MKSAALYRVDWRRAVTQSVLRLLSLPLVIALLAGSPAFAQQGIVIDSEDHAITVFLNGQQIWRTRHTVIRQEGPRDLTGDGIDNLLVHEAPTRSHRRITLLSLQSADPRMLWQIEGHAGFTDPILEAFWEIGGGDSLPATLSLNVRPAANLPLPEEAAAPSPTISEQLEAGQLVVSRDEQRALNARLEEMGYEIQWDGHRLFLRLNGEEVWSNSVAQVVHGYTLMPSAGEEGLLLVVFQADRPRSGRQPSEVRLELTPQGVGAIQKQRFGEPIHRSPGLSRSPETD